MVLRTFPKGASVAPRYRRQARVAMKTREFSSTLEIGRELPRLVVRVGATNLSQSASELSHNIPPNPRIRNMPRHPQPCESHTVTGVPNREPDFRAAEIETRRKTAALFREMRVDPLY